MWYFLVICMCLIAVVLYRWRLTAGHWARRGVPHRPHHPLWGSIHFFMKESPAVWFREYYTSFRKTPFVGIWLMWKPALIVNCPLLAHRVLVTDFDAFRDRHMGSGDILGYYNILTAKDPLWSSTRKKLSSAFSSAKLKTYYSLINKKAGEVLQRIDMDVQNKEAVNLRSMFADYSTDVISAVLFGIDSDATLRGRSALRDVTKHFLEFNLYRGFCWSSVFFLPEVAKILRLPFFPETSTKHLNAVFRAIVNQRGGFEGGKNQTSDFIGLLMKMKREDKDIPDDLLLAQAAVLLQGGFETTSLTITYALYELAFNPQIQEKLFEELYKAVKDIDEDKIDDSHLSDITYLNCVIKETLRKYTPMGWLDRETTKSYKIGDNLTIPAGTPVYVNSAGIHYDPEFYPEPDRFIPERFLPENEYKLHPYTYLPFGDGPRVCIGTRLAHVAVRAALSRAVLARRLLPAPDSPLPRRCRFERAGILLVPADTLTLQFLSRSSKTAN